MAKIKTAILGFGARGILYADIIKEHNSSMELCAVCDINPEKRRLAENDYGVRKEYIFDDYRALYGKGKLADILIIATQDADHYKHIMPALKLGYHVLLEKPISPDIKECIKIARSAEKYKRKVSVAHVLRYSPFYGIIKDAILQNKIGDIVTVSQTENVGYWHQAHSFVRGNWNNSEKSSPMILAKCCHDLDIIRWLIGKRCLYVSSFGSLKFFKEENAPKESGKYCYNCKVDCIYNCIDFYRKNPAFYSFISFDPDVEKILSDESNPYSRCVFKCDNNVVDHQIVNMQFEDDVTAQLTMTAFSKDCRRTIKIHGTMGEIIGDMEEEKITLTRFGKGGEPMPSEEIDVAKLHNDLSGHGGGDKRLLLDFANGVNTDNLLLTDIKLSLESHIMAFMAEQSRLYSGKPKKICL